MNSYLLTPVDTLFFKDARPMQAGAGSGGHGASWPLPTVIQEALRAALLRMNNVPLEPGKAEGHLRNGRRPFIVTKHFRSLHINGPFPVRLDKGGGYVFYLPWPKDILISDEGDKKLLQRLKPVQKACGLSDLPKWLAPVVPDARPGKDKAGDWMSMDLFVQSLGLDGQLELKEDVALYDNEPRIGIEIQASTGTAKDKHLYSSEHLRLRDDVRLWFSASLGVLKQTEENLGLKDISPLVGNVLTLGGESRQCRLSNGPVFPPIPKPSGRLIKWVLATHGVFAGGWRPNWISVQDGSILLKKGDLARREDESREAWRKRVRMLPPINGRLVSACVSKPIHFSGWNASLPNEMADESGQAGGPKPSVLAVPSGSVYFFAVDTDDDGAALVRALHGRTQSDYMGEKGLGLGYCGNWAYSD